jgi:hypothetical protein
MASSLIARVTRPTSWGALLCVAALVFLSAPAHAQNLLSICVQRSTVANGVATTSCVPVSATNPLPVTTSPTGGAPKSSPQNPISLCVQRATSLNGVTTYSCVPVSGANPLPGVSGGVAPPPTSVWSAADATTNGMTLSGGGLIVTPSGASAWQTIRSSISKTSGKLYIEFSNSAVTSAINLQFGLADATFNPVGFLGSGTFSAGLSPGIGNHVSAGFVANYNTTLPVAGQSDVWALAVDFSAGNIWLADNNVWSDSSNPATASLPIATFTPATVGALFAAMAFFGTGVGIWTLQPTSASQKYTPPSGFSPWN